MLPLRLARLDDIHAVVELWNEASAWLALRGTDQWQYPVRVEAIAERIAAQRLWLLEDTSGPIATVTLDEFAEPRIWTSADDPDAALYLHRLVVARRVAGQNLGGQILEWAAGQVAATGRRYLRLDAWTSNVQLQQYYADRGFRLVRTIEAQDLPSGAAFERDVAGGVPGVPETR